MTLITTRYLIMNVPFHSETVNVALSVFGVVLVGADVVRPYLKPRNTISL